MVSEKQQIDVWTRDWFGSIKVGAKSTLNFRWTSGQPNWSACFQVFPQLQDNVRPFCDKSMDNGMVVYLTSRTSSVAGEKEPTSGRSSSQLPNMALPSKAAHWKAHCEAHPVMRETIEHFAATPSLAKHLKDESYECVPTYGRVLKPDGEDAFFAKIISSPETISHFLTLLRRDLGSLPISDRDGESQPDTITLITFGGRDLVGHPTVVHGGVSTALLDEPLSFMLHMYQVRIAGDTPKNSTFTVNLNINFRAAVPAPGQVIVECRLLKVEGRKYFVKGTMKDTSGKVLVDAQGLWLSMRAANL